MYWGEISRLFGSRLLFCNGWGITQCISYDSWCAGVHSNLESPSRVVQLLSTLCSMHAAFQGQFVRSWQRRRLLFRVFLYRLCRITIRFHCYRRRARLCSWSPWIWVWRPLTRQRWYCRCPDIALSCPPMARTFVSPIQVSYEFIIMSLFVHNGTVGRKLCCRVNIEESRRAKWQDIALCSASSGKEVEL
jgi:hypothetical protein